MTVDLHLFPNLFNSLSDSSLSTKFNKDKFVFENGPVPLALCLKDSEYRGIYIKVFFQNISTDFRVIRKTFEKSVKLLCNTSPEDASSISKKLITAIRTSFVNAELGLSSSGILSSLTTFHPESFMMLYRSVKRNLEMLDILDQAFVENVLTDDLKSTIKSIYTLKKYKFKQGTEYNQPKQLQKFFTANDELSFHKIKVARETVCRFIKLDSSNFINLDNIVIRAIEHLKTQYKLEISLTEYDT